MKKNWRKCFDSQNAIFGQSLFKGNFGLFLSNSQCENKDMTEVNLDLKPSNPRISGKLLCWRAWAQTKIKQNTVTASKWRVDCSCEGMYI